MAVAAFWIGADFSGFESVADVKAGTSAHFLNMFRTQFVPMREFTTRNLTVSEEIEGVTGRRILFAHRFCRVDVENPFVRGTTSITAKLSRKGR
jgi:hypothetical protein